MTTIYQAGYIWYQEHFVSEFGLLVEDDLIKSVDKISILQANYPDAALVDMRHLAIVPGTINAHNHSFQSLLRGIATDEPFLTWRDQALYRYTPYMDEDTLYAGALLAFGEMLSQGVTTVTDFFYIHNHGTDNDEAIIQAANDLGIRLVFARTMYDWTGAPASYRESIADAVDRTDRLIQKYLHHPLVRVHPAPHSPHGASPEMIQAGHGLAKKWSLPYHIHVAEEPFEVEEIMRDYGMRPVHYLDHLGVLDESMIAIHLVWLDDSEIELLGARQAALAYCPSSNMFLADGVTRIPDLMQAGVMVGLGSDGGCSNNRVSIFEEMRMAALLQKVNRLDATCLRASDTFAMGTANGGKLLRLPIGKLEAGYHADFVGIRIDDLSLQPFAPDLLPYHLVYSMQPTAIERVVVHGKEVVRDGRITTVDQEQIRQLVAKAKSRWP